MPRVAVISPEGRTGTVEAGELDQALAAGFKQAPAPEAIPGVGQVGQGEAALRGGVQGATLGLGEEAAAAIDAALPKVVRENLPAIIGGDVTRQAVGKGNSFIERYQRARDFYRARNAAAQQQNPWTYGGAQLAGTVATGGAVAKALTGVAPLATQTALGAVQGAGYSLAPDARQLAGDIAVGGGLGALGYGAGKALGAAGEKLAGLASRRAGQAVGEAATKVQAGAAAELGSETGRLGGMSQDLNRKIEWVIRLLDEEKSGTLSPAKRAALEAFRSTPEYAQVLDKAAERVLSAAPGAVARTAAQEAKVAALQQALPETVAKGTEAAVSGKAALDQLKARLVRYGLPALGGAIGLGHGGVEGLLAGAGIGSLAGAGMRPMMHSLKHMMQSPAVRNQLWSGAEKIGEVAASPAFTVPAGAATTIAGIGLLSHNDQERPNAAKLADVLEHRPETLPQGAVVKLHQALSTGGRQQLAATHMELMDSDPEYRQAFMGRR